MDNKSKHKAFILYKTCGIELPFEAIQKET